MESIVRYRILGSHPAASGRFHIHGFSGDSLAVEQLLGEIVKEHQINLSAFKAVVTRFVPAPTATSAEGNSINDGHGGNSANANKTAGGGGGNNAGPQPLHVTDRLSNYESVDIAVSRRTLADDNDPSGARGGAEHREMAARERLERMENQLSINVDSHGKDNNSSRGNDPASSLAASRNRSDGGGGKGSSSAPSGGGVDRLALQRATILASKLFPILPGQTKKRNTARRTGRVKKQQQQQHQRRGGRHARAVLKPEPRNEDDDDDGNNADASGVGGASNRNEQGAEEEDAEEHQEKEGDEDEEEEDEDDAHVCVLCRLKTFAEQRPQCCGFPACRTCLEAGQAMMTSDEECPMCGRNLSQIAAAAAAAASAALASVASGGRGGIANSSATQQQRRRDGSCGAKHEHGDDKKTHLASSSLGVGGMRRPYDSSGTDVDERRMKYHRIDHGAAAIAATAAGGGYLFSSGDMNAAAAAAAAAAMEAAAAAEVRVAALSPAVLQYESALRESLGRVLSFLEDSRSDSHNGDCADSVPADDIAAKRIKGTALAALDEEVAAAIAAAAGAAKR